MLLEAAEDAVIVYVPGGGPSSGGALQTVTTTAGAPVTVSYTPPVEGDNTLQAFAFTATGVVSGGDVVADRAAWSAPG